MEYIVQRIKCSPVQSQISSIKAGSGLDALRIYCEQRVVTIGTGLYVVEDKLFGPRKWCYIVEAFNPFSAKVVDEVDIPDQTKRFLSEDSGSSEKDKEDQDNQSEINDAIKNITITTAPNIEGFNVVETVDVITAECVFGINIFSEFLSSFSDVFGGRSGTTQNKLRDARKVCLAELRKEAYLLGANAVIAVDLDYSEMTGNGKSMLFLVASGTAVKISKIEM